jgi:uncharacterized protein YggE
MAFMSVDNPAPQGTLQFGIEPRPLTLVVTGRGEAYAKPDRVVLRLEAIAQSKNPAATQKEVNQIMEHALKAIRDLGLADTQSPETTDGRSSPGQRRQARRKEKIETAYRASHTVTRPALHRRAPGTDVVREVALTGCTNALRAVSINRGPQERPIVGF